MERIELKRLAKNAIDHEDWEQLNKLVLKLKESLQPVERVGYRESDYTTYKGFQIWGTGKSWTIETTELNPDSKEFWKFRNEQEDFKTMAQAKKWIKEEGIQLIEDLKKK